MRIIGITGGVGAGKSEILSYIRKHYLCEIYLADQVAHEVKRQGTACFDKLVALLGEDVVGEDGEIQKDVMAQKIFADSSVLKQTNEIIHPEVRAYLLDRIEEANMSGKIQLFFVEAALLIECGYKKLVDELWYIYATEDVRKSRLKKSRGYSDEKINQIMANQLSEERFRQNCDFVIDNSGDLQETCYQIDRKLEAFTWRE